MVLDTTKETICVNQIIGQKHDNLVVEGDMIVPDIKPDVLNTIEASGNVCIYKKEVLEGKIRIDGSVNVYIMYVADNETGDVRSLNTSVDFTDIIDFAGCKPSMSIDEKICIKNIECNVINERKIGIKVVLDTNIKIYSNESIEVISEIADTQNLQILENTIDINCLIGEGSTNVYAKDTIVLDTADDLGEIMKANLTVVNAETKVSYNKVLAKAEVEVKIMYLTEDNRINSVTRKIPIAGFIDLENVTDSHICSTKYKLKNLIIKPNSGEDNSIYVEAEFEITCFVYENKTIRLIEDLYCPNMSLNFKQKNIETRALKNRIEDIIVVKERFNLENNTHIYDTDIKINILTTRIQNGIVYYDGELELNYIYGGANSNQVKTKNIKFPFTHSITLPTEERNLVETEVNVQEASVIIMPDNTVEITANAQFIVEVYKDEKINIIDEIDMDENMAQNSYSMVIYYTKKGDTLWKIAKMFNSTVEEIAKANNIENPDVIDAGMQLFIPRYASKVAV